jgi:uncharacterized membrane protein YjjP (DUF1212 family)
VAPPTPIALPLSTETPLPVSERSRRRTAEELSDYVLQLGELLLRYGCPAYRVENLIRVVAELEDHEAESFALPTALFVSVARVENAPGRVAPVHRMARVREWGIDLEKLLHVDRVFNDVAAGKRSIEDAREELVSLETRPRTYSAPWIWLAMAASGAGAAVLFRGGVADVAAATLVALVIHALGQLLGRHPQARFLNDFVGALLASLLATGATITLGCSRDAVLLAGLLTLFPGMTFTTGLAELVQKNLVAGAARLMEASVTFIALVFGIALSVTLTTWLAIEATSPAPSAGLPLPIQAIAATGVSLALGVLFQVPKRLLWTALVSGGAGYVATALAGPNLPPHAAAFLAATAVCSLANVLARTTGRPAQLYHLPGMMLLVPGSLGFLSLEEMLRGTYQAGVAKGLQALLIAGGLVMGVLVANVILPPKKLL